MLTDGQGLAVSTDAPDVIHAIDRFTDQLLGYGSQPEIIFEAVAADPTCVLANAHAAALHLFAETGDAVEQAMPYLHQARAGLATVTPREALYVEAIVAWAQGEVDRALAYHDRLAAEFPRDLISVQIGQYHYFNLGDAPGLLNLIETVLPANAENHYLYGMQAFGLEQCHRLAEAEAAGRRATELDRRDPWAHHAVAHVMETQGRTADGIAWMESFADVWEDIGTFYTHNWWHVALYYLAQEDFSAVLDLYDRRIWGRADQTYSQCQIDAVSLLMRLALRGVDVGDRWQTVAAHLKHRLHEHILPFLDLQYVYALAKAGYDQQVAEMLQSMHTHAVQTSAYARSAWLDVAVPAAEALVAHARGDRQTAQQLGAILPRLHEVGGSHAQRDVFQQIYRDVHETKPFCHL